MEAFGLEAIPYQTIQVSVLYVEDHVPCLPFLNKTRCPTTSHQILGEDKVSS
jgi:hypothetical protein